LLARVHAHGGLTAGVAARVAREVGVAEAEVYGTASFYHLLSEPATKLRVCTGLSCAMRGAGQLLAAAERCGLPVSGCSCLAACDRAPAVLRDRDVLVEVGADDLARSAGDWRAVRSTEVDDVDWKGAIGSGTGELALNLAAEPDYSGSALIRAREQGAETTLATIDAAALQGRGGAGFPTALKWRSIREQAEKTRYVVLNGDEGEPGTFKDRELLLRRPDLVVEGLAIAAFVLGAREIYLYLRGEFGAPRRSLESAVERFRAAGLLDDLNVHFHAGHGSYICGEETALLEALEGRRGMPRLKPPFPSEAGLWHKPTLIQNVETIACVPAIVRRGGEWFRALGRSEAGTKLYCVSGDVVRPGTYELPLGATLDELVDTAGGYLGTLRAFSPGGASSGFLPASDCTVPLDFASLAKRGSMLGSAGVVVLNDQVNLRWAVRRQLTFFEEESCGQCAPCRIGTRFMRRAVERLGRDEERPADVADTARELEQVAEAAWEMNEGSICGLGQAAALPLTSALRHFPEEFSR